MELGIIVALSLIAFLEICRYFRRIGSCQRDVEELKARVESLEQLLQIKDKNNDSMGD